MQILSYLLISLLSQNFYVMHILPFGFLQDALISPLRNLSNISPLIKLPRLGEQKTMSMEEYKKQLKWRKAKQPNSLCGMTIIKKNKETIWPLFDILAFNHPRNRPHAERDIFKKEKINQKEIKLILNSCKCFSCKNSCYLSVIWQCHHHDPPPINLLQYPVDGSPCCPLFICSSSAVLEGTCLNSPASRPAREKYWRFGFSSCRGNPADAEYMQALESDPGIAIKLLRLKPLGQLPPLFRNSIGEEEELGFGRWWLRAAYAWAGK